MNGIQLGNEEAKFSLFRNDVILHIRERKDSVNRLLELIREFGKVTGHAISEYKSIVSVSTNNSLDL